MVSKSSGFFGPLGGNQLSWAGRACSRTYGWGTVAPIIWLHWAWYLFFSLLRSCFPAPCPRVAAPCHFATLSLHYAHTNNHILSHCPRNDLPPQCHCNTDIADFSKLFLMSPAPGPCVAAGYCCICSAVPTVHVSAPSFRSPLFPASCPRDAFAALCSPMSRMFPETS